MTSDLFKEHDRQNRFLNMSVSLDPISGIRSFHKRVVSSYRCSLDLRKDLASKRFDINTAKSKISNELLELRGLKCSIGDLTWLSRAYFEGHAVRSSDRYFTSYHCSILDTGAKFWEDLNLNVRFAAKEPRAPNGSPELTRKTIAPWRVGRASIDTRGLYIAEIGNPVPETVYCDVESLAQIADYLRDGLPDLDDEYLTALQSEMELACKLLTGEEGAEGQQKPIAAQVRQESKNKKSKQRKSIRSRTDDLIIGALCEHHKFDDGGCQNMDPIGGNDLAELAGVASGSVTGFWKCRFRSKNRDGNHGDYKRSCENNTLPSKLALWRGELPTEEAIKLIEDRIAAKQKVDDD